MMTYPRITLLDCWAHWALVGCGMSDSGQVPSGGAVPPPWGMEAVRLADAAK